MSNMTEQEPPTNQTWITWDGEPGLAKLDSGWTVQVEPGDHMFVEFDAVTGDIYRILQHRKRTLH